MLKQARVGSGLTQRDVERRTGLGSGHLSQIETGAIVKPEIAILWDLAMLYDLDFGAVLGVAGFPGDAAPSRTRRQRMAVALRAMDQLTSDQQNEALRYMADLKARRRDG